jgi:hypothetical protein
VSGGEKESERECVYLFVYFLLSFLFKRVGGSSSSSIENNVCTYFVCVFLNFVVFESIVVVEVVVVVVGFWFFVCVSPTNI